MNLTVLAQVTLGIPSVLGAVSLLIAIFWPAQRRAGQWLGALTVAASIVLLAISIAMIAAPAEAYPIEFSLNLSIITVDFHIDALSLFFVFLVNIIAFVVSWNDIAYLEHTEIQGRLQQPATFHGLVNLFHFTMLLVPMVNNLVGLWIAIELTTLFSAFLVAYENKRDSWEAAWKYLIITSTGIILALLGTIFLANAVPTDQMPTTPNTGLPSDVVMDWTFLMRLAKAGLLEKDFVRISFLFALLGYGTKAGLAPMHTWLPDGHGEAPSPISALLSGVLLKSALYAILRFYTLTNAVLSDATFTSRVLLGVGLISLMLAVPFILRENRFKRVLAYHSLEHMGIITFGLGLGGPIALFGVVLHCLNHALNKALMFLAFGNIMRQYTKYGIQQEDITGILRSMPITGGILTLGGLALVGMPPFNIFMSELIILWGALSRFWNKGTPGLPRFDNWMIIGAVILFMVSTTLIFYGLVKHLGKLVLHKMLGDRKLEENFVKDLFPLVSLFFFMLLLGIWIIPPLSNLISESVRIILGQGFTQ